MNERGTALIEMIVAGFLVMAVTLPTLHAVVRLADGHARVAAAADDHATWFARHGTSLHDDRQDILTTVTVEGDHVTARSTVSVELIAIGGATVQVSVSEEATARASPYRSDR